MINKKAQQEHWYLGYESIGIIIAALALIILISLGFKVLYGYSQSKNLEEKAESTLNEIKSVLIEAETEKKEKPYIFLTPANWYLASYEFKDLCTGDFCLCLCEKEDCNSAHSCIPTEKFALIRETSSREAKTIYMANTPVTLSISFSEDKVIPFNADYAPIKGWTTAVRTSTLFFKFDNAEWKWSPDLKNWMDTSTLTVQGGVWNGVKPTENNQIFISETLGKVKNSDEKGKNFFNEQGAHSSEGVYIIQKK